MNKQELIERIEGLKNIFGNKCEYVKIDFIIELVSELDKPEKVKVPQFVADWYEENKDCFELNLWLFLTEFDEKNIDRFGMWLGDEDNNPIQTLVNMHQFGYEVEKEKKYIVILKSSGQKLYYHTEDEDYIFSSYDGVFYSGYHTKIDLEENGMSWVFDCEGLEVQEVE